MSMEDCIAELKGIKALLYILLDAKENVADMEFAAMYLSSGIGECIQFLQGYEKD